MLMLRNSQIVGQLQSRVKLCGNKRCQFAEFSAKKPNQPELETLGKKPNERKHSNATCFLPVWLLKRLKVEHGLPLLHHFLFWYCRYFYTFQGQIWITERSSPTEFFHDDAWCPATALMRLFHDRSLALPRIMLTLARPDRRNIQAIKISFFFAALITGFSSSNCRCWVLWTGLGRWAVFRRPQKRPKLFSFSLFAPWSRLLLLGSKRQAKLFRLNKLFHYQSKVAKITPRRDKKYLVGATRKARSKCAKYAFSVSCPHVVAFYARTQTFPPFVSRTFNIL